MTAWYTARRTGWPARAVIAAGLLAVLLVAAMPAALLAGVVLMALGHVIGGLAVFGASVLTAGAAVMIAGMSGVRQVRKLVSQQVSQRGYPVVQLRRGEYDYD
jgi:uncharacterized membrane protein YdjX (TVP38/TMEM64 family)